MSPLDGLPDPGGAPEAVRTTAPHLLVVEDNPTNQLVITLFLRKLGVTHDLVERGTDALTALDAGGYDLVLMDIEMPVLDGYATTREIRRHEAALGRARTPVIALSADALPDSRVRAREAGMDDFLTKPIAMDALHRALGSFGLRAPAPLVGA